MSKKIYYSIGEVSKMLDIKPYTIRYWESEITQLKPRSANVRNRRFDEKDIQLLIEIKELIYKKRFTLEGAKKAISQTRKAEKLSNDSDDFKNVMVKSLKEIKEILLKR
ncbi:MAG TPA: MerR family transcriptional regulator [Candidatus Cloacimonadota bacterium]|jgi:DNA-binding transcriptional MerR regulator|nr:MerR family transcriptional regulator [Candidatus Cloacimonadales bacterium]HPY95875.1 MerR family transcriptional regulator [Candidatus Cloacimonadota bacterium]HQB41030.1 MerR family transcriptional regulator [Candidatus Cloacimonadota bacterium]